MRAFTFLALLAVILACASSSARRGRPGRRRPFPRPAKEDDVEEEPVESVEGADDEEEPDLDEEEIAELTEEDFEEMFHTLTNDPEELERRREALREHIKNIIENNADPESTFWEKLNKWSDLPIDEFRRQREGLIRRPPQAIARSTGAIMLPADHPDRVLNRDDQTYFRSIMGNSVPNAYSAVAAGLVSPVKNQRSCGSCVSYATTAAVETCLKKAAGGAILDLSEQYWVDCGFDETTAWGCDGAYTNAYAKKIAESAEKSQPAEPVYPYMATRGTCKKTAFYDAGAKVTAFHDTYSYVSDTFLKQLVHDNGAVISSMRAADRSFNDYAGGVFDGCSTTAQDHAITIVGWGTESGKDYWLVKNSWGSSWGENGYVKVKMGSCGIGEEAVVVRCQATGTDPEPVPTTAAPPPVEKCNLKDGSIYNNYDLTGRYLLTTTVNGVRYGSRDVTCKSSNCERTDKGDKPCRYICGRDRC